MILGGIKRGDIVYTVYMATISRWYVVDVLDVVENSVRKQKIYVYLDMPSTAKSCNLTTVYADHAMTLDKAIEEARWFVEKQVIALKGFEE
jgi:hypothetical protein